MREVRVKYGKYEGKMRERGGKDEGKMREKVTEKKCIRD